MSPSRTMTFAFIRFSAFTMPNASENPASEGSKYVLSSLLSMDTR